jgi:hypothetical protein
LLATECADAKFVIEETHLKAKLKVGRPKGKRLPKGARVDFRHFLEVTLRLRKIQPKNFHKRVSHTLKRGYNVDNTEVTVKRQMSGICAGKIPFRVEYQEAVRTVLRSALPVTVDEFLNGRKSHSGEGIRSNLNTKQYFDRFFRYLKSTRKKKEVKVFARWTNLEARRIMLKFGPHDLFQRFDEAWEKGLLNIEYVFFLISPASLQLRDVKKILKRYRHFASAIYIHFLSRTNLQPGELSKTISLWGGRQSVFTHDWDYKGNIYKLFEWPREADRDRLMKNYEKIKADSQLYFQRVDASGGSRVRQPKRAKGGNVGATL